VTAGRNAAWAYGRWVAAILAGAALLGLIAFLGIGRWLEAPGESPSKADVIVLLGGNSKSRLIAGVELYRQGWAPRILIVGEAGDSLPAPHPLPSARLIYLLGEGIPRDVMFVEDRSHNSWEEAVNTLGFMRQQGWHKALVVSDPPHIRRLSWIWRRVWKDEDLEYALVPSHPWWWRASEWWRDQWSGEFVRTEVLKIAYYLAVR
jgi:uncharacterized SAM-binding protein YcdF (DUF218 family)